MTTPFWKLHGAGNDFIAIDGRLMSLERLGTQVSAWCDRRLGIGADGVLHVTPTDSGTIDLHYLNSDGSDAFCGNGLRCSAVFATVALGLSNLAHIGTVSGRCDVHGIQPDASGWQVAVSVPAADAPVAAISLAPQWASQAHRVRVGVPHVILPITDIEHAPVDELGPVLRSHPALGIEGANVNWVAVDGDGLRMRTYERGVEAETLACGSGAVAVAYWWWSQHPPMPVDIQARSGDILTVSPGAETGGHTDATDPILAGPVALAFTGSVD